MREIERRKKKLLRYYMGLRLNLILTKSELEVCLKYSHDEGYYESEYNIKFRS